MYDLLWVLVAGWIGFLAGFLVCSMICVSARSLSDEELAEAARDYYTEGGIAVYGQYSKGQKGFKGWAPLPKKPE